MFLAVHEGASCARQFPSQFACLHVSMVSKCAYQIKRTVSKSANDSGAPSAKSLSQTLLLRTGVRTGRRLRVRRREGVPAGVPQAGVPRTAPSKLGSIRQSKWSSPNYWPAVKKCLATTFVLVSASEAGFSKLGASGADCTRWPHNSGRYKALHAFSRLDSLLCRIAIPRARAEVHLERQRGYIDRRLSSADRVVRPAGPGGGTTYVIINIGNT